MRTGTFFTCPHVKASESILNTEEPHKLAEKTRTALESLLIYGALGALIVGGYHGCQHGAFDTLQTKVLGGRVLRMTEHGPALCDPQLFEILKKEGITLDEWVEVKEKHEDSK